MSCDLRHAPALLAALVLLAALPSLVHGNGGTLRVANVAMGDYRVSVFTDPTPVRPDSLDVSVLVLQEGVEGVPEGVGVTVTARLLEGYGEADHLDRHQGPHVLQATRAQADDPRYYAAKFALGAEGRWEITVAVAGGAGAGEASFEVNARERGLLGHPLVLMILALLPLAGAAAWILRDERGRTAGEGASGRV